jgi:IS30 family transposase
MAKRFKRNTNGLIKQYLPKKACLRDTEILTIINMANKLNNRPQKTLKFKTPFQVFMATFIIYALRLLLKSTNLSKNE